MAIFMTVLILTLIAAVLFTVIVLVFIYILATLEVFFAFCPEGEIITITKSEGLQKFIASIKDRVIDPLTGKIKKGKQRKSLINRFLGAYWIGLPPSRVMYYPFHWNKWAKEIGESEYKMIPRQELVRSLFYIYPYSMKVDAAETSELVELDVILLVTTEITNAEKAEFKIKPVGMWLNKLTTVVTAKARDFMGRYTFEQLVHQRLEGETSKFSQTILSLNPNLKAKFGVIINSVDFVKLDLTGEMKKKLQQASTAEYVAKREAGAAIQTAEGTKKSTILIAEGEAQKILLLAAAEQKRAETALQKIVEVGAASIVIAESVRDVKNISTLVLGQSSGIMVDGRNDQTQAPKNVGP